MMPASLEKTENSNWSLLQAVTLVKGTYLQNETIPHASTGDILVPITINHLPKTSRKKNGWIHKTTIHLPEDFLRALIMSF
jgi:hypothetical protein